MFLWVSLGNLGLTGSAELLLEAAEMEPRAWQPSLGPSHAIELFLTVVEPFSRAGQTQCTQRSASQ